MARMFTRSSGKIGFSKYQHPVRPYKRDTERHSGDMMMFHRTSGKDGHKTFWETVKNKSETKQMNKHIRFPDRDDDTQPSNKSDISTGAKSEAQSEPPQGTEKTVESPKLRRNQQASGKSLPYPPAPRMFHITSGKALSDYYMGNKLEDKVDFELDRDLVIRMLKMEQKLRMSKETQEEYDRQSRGESRIPPCTIEDNIQKRVLESHGIEPSEENLSHYRCINGLYPNDQEVRQLIVYMKYDRSKLGDLRPGMMWPDVTFNTVNIKTCKLSELYTDQTQPLVLLAASIS